MDTLFSLWWSSKYEGWLGVESKIPKGVYDYYNNRTIKSYNNMTGLTSKDIIKRRRSLLLTWSLTSYGVPQGKPPYGDCGIYAVKFLVRLVMGVAFLDEHLRDPNMKIMRGNLLGLSSFFGPSMTRKALPGHTSPTSFNWFFFLVIFSSTSLQRLLLHSTRETPTSGTLCQRGNLSLSLVLCLIRN
ncbi:hypothetical protein YC2023_071411 [Brassica napus]